MDFLLVLLVMAAVVLVVAWPLYHAGRGSGDALPSDVAALEAARDAKFREIRDNELDHRTGKLSEADFRAVDERLRTEAVALLDALDAARAADGGRERPQAGPPEAGDRPAERGDRPADRGDRPAGRG